MTPLFLGFPSFGAICEIIFDRPAFTKLIKIPALVSYVVTLGSGRSQCLPDSGTVLDVNFPWTMCKWPLHSNSGEWKYTDVKQVVVEPNHLMDHIYVVQDGFVLWRTNSTLSVTHLILCQHKTRPLLLRVINVRFPRCILSEKLS